MTKDREGLLPHLVLPVVSTSIVPSEQVTKLRISLGQGVTRDRDYRLLLMSCGTLVHDIRVRGHDTVVNVRLPPLDPGVIKLHVVMEGKRAYGGAVSQPVPLIVAPEEVLSDLSKLAVALI